MSREGHEYEAGSRRQREDHRPACPGQGSKRKPARPRWAILHPDHWTAAEVRQWVVHVADEYRLADGAKVTLSEVFADVDGRHLATMTLEDFKQRDKVYGPMLFYVYSRITSTGQVKPCVWNRPMALTTITEDHRRPGTREHNSQALPDLLHTRQDGSQSSQLLHTRQDGSQSSQLLHTSEDNFLVFSEDSGSRHQL